MTLDQELQQALIDQRNAASLLASADARLDAVRRRVNDAFKAEMKASEARTSRRADWHYDSQGYCDNPGRGY